MDDMSSAPRQVPDLVARIAAGDREAIVELLARDLTRLRRAVALRLDASDEIREGHLKAINRMDPIDREILVLRHDEQMNVDGDAS
jgi:RNA polymerase sigma-70 factor, ECF subfamily